MRWGQKATSGDVHVDAVLAISVVVGLLLSIDIIIAKSTHKNMNCRIEFQKHNIVQRYRQWLQGRWNRIFDVACKRKQWDLRVRVHASSDFAIEQR